MSKNIYVGNLHSATTSHDLLSLCTQFGSVLGVELATDVTGASRGFAYVEMADGADAAIDALNHHVFQGKALMVNEAKIPDRPKRGPFKKESSKTIR